MKALLHTHLEIHKELLASIYNLKPEEIYCEGCLSEKPFVFCQSCAMAVD